MFCKIHHKYVADNFIAFAAFTKWDQIVGRSYLPKVMQRYIRAHLFNGRQVELLRDVETGCFRMMAYENDGELYDVLEMEFCLMLSNFYKAQGLTG